MGCPRKHRMAESQHASSRFGSWGLSGSNPWHCARMQAARVPFHILGLKCPGCASYNTRRLGIVRAPPPPPPAFTAPQPL